MEATKVEKKKLEEGSATPANASDDGSQELVNCGRPFPEHAVAVVSE